MLAQRFGLMFCLLSFLLPVGGNHVFSQSGFYRDDSYDFTGVHHLRLGGVGPNSYNVFIESGSDFRWFKLHVKNQYRLSPTWWVTRTRVDMNNDGSWDQNWTTANFTVPFYYPSPANGISETHTIRIETEFMDLNGAVTTRTKYTTITVFSLPRVYKTVMNDVLIQLRNDDPTDKIPILLVEGFDPLNEKFPETYYNLTWDLVHSDLDPNEYAVFFLNFADGGRDLRLNAEVLLKAIERIQVLCPTNRVALAGLSMGGPISRYALAKTEEVGGVHNVGLFLSYDSPQKWAHVNPGLQDWIRLRNPNDVAIGLLQANLQSEGAKQMLGYNTYDPQHLFRDEFYNELNALNGDGYPHQSYNVAVTNGNFNATWGNTSIGRHLLTLKINDELIHHESAVEFDCETGSKMSDITMKRYGDIFHNPFIHVYYELEFVFNPAYTPTWSALDLVNWFDDPFGNIISFERSKFDDYVVQLAPLEHHELSTITREKIVNWLNKTFTFNVSYNFLEGGSVAPDAHQTIILRGNSIAVPSRTVTVNGRPITYHFFRWDDNNSENPRTFFTSRDTTRIAKMKAHLATDQARSFANTNQQQLVYDGVGTHHLVYESGGEIWYTAIANGSTGSREFLVSDSEGQNMSPSIAVSNENNLQYVRIVWTKAEGQGSIWYRDKVSPIPSPEVNMGWNPREQIPLTSPAGHAPHTWQPVVGEHGWVVTNRYHSGGSGGSIRVLQRDYNGTWGQTTMPTTSQLVTAPSMISTESGCWVVAEQAGEIKYNKVQRNGASFVWQTTIDITSGSGRPASGPPSIAWANRQSNDLFVTWPGMNSASNRNEIVVRRGSGGEFRYFRSCESEQSYSHPVIRDLGQGNMLLAWKGSNDAVHAARFDGGSNTWFSADAGVYSDQPVTIAGNSHGTTGKLAYVTGPSAPYVINLLELNPPPAVTSQLRASGWNLVSVPNAVSDYHACAVLPTVISQVFSYTESQGYAAQSMLANGPGYLAKFPDIQSNITFAGNPITSLTFNVPSGWTFIGSISVPIHVSKVGTSPEGNIRSGIFELRNSGYHIADSIRPGVAYWARMNHAGTVSLPAGVGGPVFEEEVLEYDKFTITDSDGKEQVVYVRNHELTDFPDIDTEMPPALPEAAFDVRFMTGEAVMSVHPDSGDVDVAIAINEAEYPVVISWEINPANGITYLLDDPGLGKVAVPGAVGSKVIATRGSGVVRFVGSAAKTSHHTAIPAEFALNQNYPNPFNPSTTFSFDLPQEAAVSLVVYDVLGKKVQEIVAGNFEAGYHKRTWNATGIASSGVYFAHFTATSDAGESLYRHTMKVVLMK